MLAEGGHHDNRRKVGAAEPADDIEAVELRHLKVEKHKIRFEIGNFAQGVFPVVRFADEMDAGHERQFFAQNLTGDGFVVDDQRLNRSIHPYLYNPNRREREKIVTGGATERGGWAQNWN